MSVPGTVIAHRAGDDLAGLARAAAHADVLEADVRLFRGRLEVRHAKGLGPLPVRWERWYLLDRATPRVGLGALLEAAAPLGATLMLDVKGYDPRMPALVLAATRGWRARRPLVVSARSWRVADRLRGEPGVRTLHSVGRRRQVAHLLRRYRPGSLEGVSVDRRILTPAIVAALRERAAEVWSWPVDDPGLARELAGWGVTGFISDDPAALRPRP
ncbi:glycerophosphodiester phosphodiesterase [Miltoncostaea marina]|uniref:glycerophosphodiester phosphodiesterase n=1 Tax=Miltoncostaea marina TaxID=2843215 RepID=UPI001C3C460E|nr:hypothetical protein [Miltoncostaea marina]